MIYALTNAVVTAYCACQICCGRNAKGIDASGHKPIEGITIAIPRRFPLGSRVIIEGHEYIGSDRLSKRFNSRFDIYFKSHSDAVRFGKQTKRVTVITPKHKIK